MMYAAPSARACSWCSSENLVTQAMAELNAIDLTLEYMRRKAKRLRRELAAGAGGHIRVTPTVTLELVDL